MARRKPHNPAAPVLPSQGHYRGQLGLPTPERASHMLDGYEVKQLAIGHDREGGVVQSREKVILNHPQLLLELYNAVVQQYAEKGEELPARIDIKQTPADRATAPYRGILWSYITTHLEVLRGNIRVTDYEGVPQSSDMERFHVAALQQTFFNRRRFYAWVREQIGMACVTDFLDRVAVHDNPGLADDADRILKKHEIGRELLGKQLVCSNCGTGYGITDRRSCRDCGATLHARDRDAENAFYGALSMCARVLSEAAKDFEISERRHHNRIRLSLNKTLA